MTVASEMRGYLGDTTGARADAAVADRLVQAVQLSLNQALLDARLGQSRLARRSVDSLLGIDRPNVFDATGAALAAARVLVMLGDYQRAIEVLEGITVGYVFNFRAPEFSVLAEDPRFQKVVDALEEWQRSDLPSGPRR